jgi:hypothetical protein
MDATRWSADLVSISGAGYVWKQESIMIITILEVLVHAKVDYGKVLTVMGTL